MTKAPSERIKIYQEINSERDRQDAKWGGPAHDDTHSLDEWLGYIREHSSKCQASLSAEERRRRLIEVAALSVAALESFDRMEVER